MQLTSSLFRLLAGVASLRLSLAKPLKNDLSFPVFGRRYEARFYPNAPSITCSTLSSKLSTNETFTPASVDYTALYQEPWSQTCWLEPACIVTPANEQQLAEALNTLITTKTKFAIRSGGHSSSPGFGSIGADGVLVSLQNFNTLTMSPDNQTVTVGSGNRWRDVYSYVANYNVTVIGGREPPVGVGGFLLGGGLGIFYNTYGLGLDNFIMLANGTVLNATQTENPQLYRGLKGGMSNFGIVLDFEIMTHPHTTISFGISLYAPNNTEAVLKAYTNYLLVNSDNQTNIEVEVTTDYTLVFYGGWTLSIP